MWGDFSKRASRMGGSTGKGLAVEAVEQLIKPVHEVACILGFHRESSQADHDEEGLLHSGSIFLLEHVPVVGSLITNHHFNIKSCTLNFSNALPQETYHGPTSIGPLKRKYPGAAFTSHTDHRP